MPSNHSHFIAYFSTYYSILFLVDTTGLHILLRFFYFLLLVLLAILVCFSR